MSASRALLISFALLAALAAVSAVRLNVIGQDSARYKYTRPEMPAPPQSAALSQMSQSLVPIAEPHEGPAARLGAATPHMVWNMTYTNTTWLRYMFDDGNLIYVDSYYFMLALNENNGAIAWAFPDLTAYTVLLTTFDIIVLYEDEFVYALQASTGVFAWDLTDPNLELFVDPKSPNAVVYGYDTSTDDILALDGRTGNLLWSVFSRGAVTEVYGGYIFVEDNSCGPNGCYQLNAFAASNGVQVWTSPLMYGYPFVFTSYSHAGYVYMNDNNWLAKFEVSTGTVLYNVSAPYFTAMIVVLPSAVYAVQSNTVYRVDPNTGLVLWSTNVCNSCGFTSVVDEDKNILYVTSSSANTEQLWALRLSDGSLAWSDNFPSESIEDAVLDHNGYVYYIASADEENFSLYVRNGATGNAVIPSFQFTVAYNQYQMCDLPRGPLHGVLYVVCDANLLAFTVPTAPTGSSNGGAIAAGVICSLLGVGLIAGGVWYVKKRGGLGSFSMSSYKPFGSSSAGSKGAYASSSAYSTIVPATATASGSYHGVTEL